MEVVVILTRTVKQRNYEVPLSALAAEEQDDAGGGFDGQSARDLDLHVKNWDNHGDEADDQTSIVQLSSSTIDDMVTRV
jgi:hypothetical protein